MLTPRYSTPEWQPSQHMISCHIYCDVTPDSYCESHTVNITWLSRESHSATLTVWVWCDIKVNTHVILTVIHYQSHTVRVTLWDSHDNHNVTPTYMISHTYHSDVTRWSHCDVAVWPRCGITVTSLWHHENIFFHYLFIWFSDITEQS